MGDEFQKDFDERVEEIRKERIQPTPLMEELAGDDLVRPTTSTITPTAPSKRVRLPRMLLACSDCDVFYRHEDDWEHCPKCGTELEEVVKA